MMQDSRIDGGKGFDWGRTSLDYAKYRDIYPNEFYETIHSLGLCTAGQTVLDLGTGTGVLPRNLYRFGATFTATDIAENQIVAARNMAADMGMEIEFHCASAEESDFPQQTFDVITACQCHFYFKHDIMAPLAHKLLRPGGKMAFLYMAWLPLEDTIAAASEKLILKYNPGWTGCNEVRHKIAVPDEYLRYFHIEQSLLFDVGVPFTRESWDGRMRACRGIGASLSEDEIARFEAEHLALLEQMAGEHFTIAHYCAIVVLEKI